MDTENAPKTQPSGKRRAVGRPRREDRAHLVRHPSGTWHFRRMISGRIEKFTLNTRDLVEARRLRDAHLLKPREILKKKSDGPDLSPVEPAIDAFLADRLAHGLRPASLASYAAILRLFAQAFPGAAWQTLAPDTWGAWLRARYDNPTSRASIARHCAALFAWATTTDTLNNAPLSAFRLRAVRRDIAVDYLSVDEARALIGAADAASLPALALGLFAGIRPDEVARMRWADVVFAERRVRIREDAAKNRVARDLADLPAAIWRHLAPYADRSGPIAPHARANIERARRLAHLTRWPHDALRHTFATYYCAQTGNPGIVAGILGHASLAMLARHYRGAATRAAAAAFFDL